VEVLVDLTRVSSTFDLNFTAPRICESRLQFFFERLSTEQRNWASSWIAISFHFAMKHWILSRAFISVPRENEGSEKRSPTIGDLLFVKMEKRE
jgi:hypothetical protein